MTRVYEASRRASVPTTPDALPLSTSGADGSSIANELAFDRFAAEAHPVVDGSPSSTLRDPDVPTASSITPRRVALFSSPTPLPSAARLLDSKLIARGEMLPAQVEQYRRLSAALQELQDRSRWPGQSAVERGLKTVLVTSALPREGKTLTVVNVACALSDFVGRRVLVIDANLCSPSIHEMLGLPNVLGLGDILSSRAQDVPLQQVSPLVSVLPAGHCVPALTRELTSNRMRALLDEWSSRFDWVLLDAPSVRLLPDPQQLARVARAVLLVIGSGSTPVSVIDKAASALGRGSIIGTVLNRVDGTA